MCRYDPTTGIAKAYEYLPAPGQFVKLQGINFIKVFTGVNQSAGSLGETSAEISNVEEF